MRQLCVKLCGQLHRLLRDERGQDLVEYALLLALVLFGAVAAMRSLATSISAVFANVNTILSSSIT